MKYRLTVDDLDLLQHQREESGYTVLSFHDQYTAAVKALQNAVSLGFFYEQLGDFEASMKEGLGRSELERRIAEVVFQEVLLDIAEGRICLPVQLRPAQQDYFWQ